MKRDRLSIHRPAPAQHDSAQPESPGPLTQPALPVVASDPLQTAPAGHTFGEISVVAEQRAVEGMAKASGGSPVHPAIRGVAEAGLGVDLSAARVHRGPEADQFTAQLDTPAVTLGSNVFLANRVARSNPQVLAHELVHVAQQQGGPASPNGAAVGARTDPAEAEADRAATALLAGTMPSPITRGQSAATARRFGMGQFGHGGIEDEAAGVAPGPPGADGKDPRKQGAAQMYSGNFMRDLNQLNVPVVVNALSALPKDPTKPLSGAVGGKGAQDITTAVIQALAILELGPEVAESLVTGGGPNKSGKPTANNIGFYRPEEHIDNPMGMGAKSDTLVANTDPNAKDKHGTKVEIGAPRPAQPVVGSLKPEPDADRDAQLKGSAIKGTQVENAELYKISGAGIQNHVYNSVEATKHRWLKAATLGPTPLGRSEFGAGSHAVEDYFSHSNFVEVALNSYIGAALANKGKKSADPAATKFAETVAERNKKELKGAEKTKQGYFVDTLFDAKADDPAQKGKVRQAVTTGSFGTTDTMVSIAHIMLPQMPRLQKAILSSVDKMFGIAAAPGGQSGWAHIKAQLATEPNSAAGAKLVEGFAHAGMVAPVPDLHLKYQKINLPIMSMAASVLGAFQPQQSTPIEIPVGVGVLSEKSVPIDQAVGEYGRIYHEAQKWIKAFHDVEAAVKGLVPFPIAQLIATVHKEIEKVDQAIRKAVKAQVVAGMVAVIDSMSGRKPEDKAKAKKDGKPLDPKDPDAEFNKDVGDALEYLHEAVEAAEKTTSLESRLKSGDLSQMSKAEVESRIGPVIEVPEHDEVSKDGKKTRVRKYYVSAKPLPPSHSEISKDHEPYSLHQDGKTGDVAHHDAHDEDQTKGSPFFGLARALALESLKHNEAQLQAVWSKRTEFGDTSVFGDKKKVEYENKADPKQSGKIHDDVMTAAEGRGKSEAERSKKEGMAFAQRDTAGLDPETGKLLNLVDFFVSHPDDTSWWKPTFDGYIAADPDSVYDGILRRNRTRGERDLDAPKK